MKKNKGYTLVELLVAMVVLVIVLMEVYMVMNSGSKVYERGSVDVALQTEAQQTILELEDLIIDVNSDIIYTPQSGTVSENGTLTIVNHDDTYIIKYVTDAKRSALGYGTLTYQHNTAGSTGTAMPLSDYVQYFYVDTSQISTHSGDSVVLSLKMNNGTYTYGASKEVFLRNKLGTGNGGGGAPSNDFDYDLLALRYKVGDYDLSDMNYECDGEACTYFVWEDATGSNFTTNMQDPSVTYYLTANKELKCGTTINTDWSLTGSARVWGYKDAATSVSNPSKHCVIQVKTDPVGCGITDETKSIAYFNWYQASSIDAVCQTQVYGIDVNSAVKANYYMEYANKGANITNTVRGTVLEKADGTQIQSINVNKTNSTIDTILSTPNSENRNYPVSAHPVFAARLIGDGTGGGNKFPVYPDNAGSGPYSNLCGAQYVYMDGDQNTFCTFNSGHWTDVQVANFDNANEKFYGYADIEFPSSHNLSFPIYGLFIGTDADTDAARGIAYRWANPIIKSY